MPGVRRLITTVDLAGTEPRLGQQASLSALHEAELTDGSRVVLLDDRGWTWSTHTFGFGDGRHSAERPGAWAFTTATDIEADARSVVGPDEADDEFTPEEVAAAHWAYLAGVLAGHGVEIEPGRLAALPHDVEFTPRVLARIDRPPPG